MCPRCNLLLVILSAIVFTNVLYQPVHFIPIAAGAGYGIFITKMGISSSTCVHIAVLLARNLAISVVGLFFYRHQCIVQKKYKMNRKKLIFCIVLLIFVVSSFHFIAFELSDVDPSLWPELLRKQYPEAMELLKIPNLYYFPASSMLKMNMTISILLSSFLVLTLLGLISHMQYIFRKQCEHLTVRTQELQKKFLKAQIIQVMVPVTLVFIPVIIVYIRLLDGRLGLQILNDILMMMMSSYGSVATFFLIFFNVPYRQFLSEKLKEFGILKNRTHETRVFSKTIELV